MLTRVISGGSLDDGETSKLKDWLTTVVDSL